MYYNIHKKRIFSHFFILVAFALLQGVFIRFSDFFLSNLNFAFIYFVYLSFYLGKSTSYKLGFILGLILDSFGATYGFYTTVFTILGYVIGFFSGKFNLQGIALPLLFAAVISVVYFLLCLIFIGWIDTIVWSRFLIDAAIQTIFNLILSPFFAWLFKNKLFKRVGIVENGK